MKTKTSLLPHQQAAVDKVGKLKVGALFMEMGTGKSRTGIEIACARFNRGKINKCVWFCPVSTKATIAAEILKHVDKPNVYVFDAKTDDTNLPDWADWYVVGLESMSACDRVILACDRLIDSKTMVILDESSYIKGHRAARTKWISNVSAKATYRLILTGTPISQGIEDLFSQFRFLDERILSFSSYYSYLSYYTDYKATARRRRRYVYQNIADLTTRIAPYTFQVLKTECLELPDKTYEDCYFSLTDAQAEAYAKAKYDFEQRAEVIYGMRLDEYEEDRSISIEIFRLYSRLQSIVCGYVDRKHINHNRIKRLIERINLVPADEKIIIWTKLKLCVDEIKDALTEYGKAVTFTGGMTERQKAEAIKQFREDARFFIATPQAGGHGLTLNEANTVIFYNNEFKYSSRAQAEDRNHRIGQTRPVHYINICAYNTIDTRIAECLDKKQNLADQFKDFVNQIKKNKSMREAKKELRTFIENI